MVGGNVKLNGDNGPGFCNSAAMDSVTEESLDYGVMREQTDLYSSQLDMYWVLLSVSTPSLYLSTGSL